MLISFMCSSLSYYEDGPVSSFVWFSMEACVERRQAGEDLPPSADACHSLELHPSRA